MRKGNHAIQLQLIGMMGGPEFHSSAHFTQLAFIDGQGFAAFPQCVKCLPSKASSFLQVISVQLENHL